jgi:hypothetical protein
MTVKASDWLHWPFDSPALPPKKTARGDKAKPSGVGPPV